MDKNIVNEDKLFNLIRKTVVDLNEELYQLNGTGVFFAPELHIAFLIGKNMAIAQKEIFNVDEAIWDRERVVGTGGPSDIIFNYKTKDLKGLCLMEVKLRNNLDAYKADVVKLLGIEKQEYHKYFCILLDSFLPKNDERILKLESEFQEKIKCINSYPVKVNQSWYEREVFCIINLFKVIN